jgi:hypothetical protein
LAMNQLFTSLAQEELSLAEKRFINNQRFAAKIDDIQRRYSTNFDDIGDEIDLVTLEVAVDNGHIRTMTHEKDVGDHTEPPTSAVPINKLVRQIAAQSSATPGVSVQDDDDDNGDDDDDDREWTTDVSADELSGEPSRRKRRKPSLTPQSDKENQRPILTDLLADTSDDARAPTPQSDAEVTAMLADQLNIDRQVLQLFVSAFTNQIQTVVTKQLDDFRSKLTNQQQSLARAPLEPAISLRTPPRHPNLHHSFSSLIDRPSKRQKVDHASSPSIPTAIDHLQETTTGSGSDGTGRSGLDRGQTPGLPSLWHAEGSKVYKPRLSGPPGDEDSGTPVGDDIGRRGGRKRSKFTEAENKLLLRLYVNPDYTWAEITAHFEGRSQRQVSYHLAKLLDEVAQQKSSGQGVNLQPEFIHAGNSISSPILPAAVMDLRHNDDAVPRPRAGTPRQAKSDTPFKRQHAVSSPVPPRRMRMTALNDPAHIEPTEDNEFVDAMAVAPELELPQAESVDSDYVKSETDEDEDELAVAVLPSVKRPPTKRTPSRRPVQPKQTTSGRKSAGDPASSGRKRAAPRRIDGDDNPEQDELVDTSLESRPAPKQTPAKQVVQMNDTSSGKRWVVESGGSSRKRPAPEPTSSGKKRVAETSSDSGKKPTYNISGRKLSSFLLSETAVISDSE